jgi:hypothetical protein
LLGVNYGFALTQTSHRGTRAGVADAKVGTSMLDMCAPGVVIRAEIAFRRSALNWFGDRRSTPAPMIGRHHYGMVRVRVEWVVCAYAAIQ